MHRTVLLLLSGLFVASALTVPVLAEATSVARSSSRPPHAAHITEASQRFGIPEAWIVAVLRAESAGNVRAVSSAGAIGLMQVMPDTWTELRARYDLGRDPYDPRDNILAGTGYLREMLDRYGDVAAILAAYNAGPARYDEHLSTGRPLPAETRAYVASLAPALRGERPSKRASSDASPQDWREAGIFVAREEGASVTGPAFSDRSANEVLSSLPATSEAVTAMQPEGLFVARDATGTGP